MTCRRHPVPRGVTAAAMLAATMLLAACAGAPPTRFHSLLPAVPAAESSRPMPVATAPGFELLPVKVPQQVDMPQLVVRQADDTLIVLEHDRWIAPLADELRAAIAQRLAHHLADGAAGAAAAARGAWQIAIELRRMDSAIGRAARLEVEWTIRASSGGAVVQRCAAVFEQAVASASVPALAAGHRAAVARLGDMLADRLRAAAKGETPRCDEPPGR